MNYQKFLDKVEIIVEGEAYIHPNTVIYGKGKLVLKKGALIEEGCTIGLGNEGEITIGENSRITRSVLEANDRSIFHRSYEQDNVFYGGKTEDNKGGKIILGKNNAIAPFSLLLASLGGTIELADNVNIMSSTLEADGGKITLGEFSYTNRYAILNGLGGITIGKHVMIAPHTSIFACNHKFYSRNKTISTQGFNAQGIIIEDDVWVAAGVQVTDGVKVSKGCILAAGALINKNTVPFCIYAGVPAKKIKERPLD